MTIADLQWRDRMARSQSADIRTLAGVVAAFAVPPLIHADWINFQMWANEVWRGYVTPGQIEPDEEQWQAMIADFRNVSAPEIEAMKASVLARHGQPTRSTSPGGAPRHDKTAGGF